MKPSKEELEKKARMLEYGKKHSKQNSDTCTENTDSKVVRKNLFKSVIGRIVRYEDYTTRSPAGDAVKKVRKVHKHVPKSQRKSMK